MNLYLEGLAIRAKSKERNWSKREGERKKLKNTEKLGRGRENLRWWAEKEVVYTIRPITQPNRTRMIGK